MARVLIIISMILALCQGLAAGESIDRLMRSEVSQRRSVGSIRLASGDEFDIPLVGGSARVPHKSSVRAGLYSLVLPGAGQYYVERGAKAKVFFGLESGFWATYYGLRKFSDFKEEAARGWAVLKAGADPGNENDLYWIKMTYYDNRDRNEGPFDYGYNQMAPFFERGELVLFPETPDYYWNWDSRADRQKYRDLRNQSKTADERADIVVGIIIAHHIVSAVDAYLSAVKFNRRAEFSSRGFNFDYAFELNPDNPSVRISLIRYLDQ